MMKLKNINSLFYLCAFCISTMSISIGAFAADNIDIGTFRNVVTGSEPNSISTTNLNVQGQIKIGWQKINNNWYYFDNAGRMKTGWLNNNGIWYYFEQNGIMAHDTTIDGCYLSSTGAWVK